MKRKSNINYEDDMLWTIVAILFVLWILGFALNFAGGIIHALLVIAVILVIVNLVRGRSA